MAHHHITGQEKYYNYKEQFERLNKALKNEFYLEAIFIEYAILEDRTESVLRHAGLWEAYMKGKKMANIGTKLTFIKNKASAKSCSLHPAPLFQGQPAGSAPGLEEQAQSPDP